MQVRLVDELPSRQGVPAQSCACSGSRSDHTRGATPTCARTALWLASMSCAREDDATPGRPSPKCRDCAPPVPASRIKSQTGVAWFRTSRLSVVMLRLSRRVMQLLLRVRLLIRIVVLWRRLLILLLIGIAVGIADPVTVTIVCARSAGLRRGGRSRRIT